YETNSTTTEERCYKSKDDRTGGVRGHDGYHPRERDGRSDRKVEIAGCEAKHHGAGDNTDGDDRLQKPKHVSLGEEVWNGCRHDGESDGKNNDEALLAE